MIQVRRPNHKIAKAVWKRHSFSTLLRQSEVVPLGSLDGPFGPRPMALSVLCPPAQISDNRSMAAIARTKGEKDETCAPYVLLGVYLGLLPVFAALVITRLIL